MNTTIPHKTQVGRPKVSTEDTVKSTITFLNKHIVFLDRLSTEIRANTMAIIDRGAIVRALIASLQDSKIDVSNMTSEEEIRTMLAKKLRQ